MSTDRQMTSVRRALIVAYVFPPAGGAGVQRVTKFVKYLPEFGWDCSVLTVANPSVPVFDQTLEGEIPEDTVIRRARTLEPGYALKNAVSAGSDASRSRGPGLIKRQIKSAVRAAGNAVLQPDAQILWYPHAVREGMRLLEELQHDAIFVTAPPFSAFLTAAELSRRSGLPLIVDYRDEWGISNRFQENRQKSFLSNWIQARMQRRVLRRATSVVATTMRSAESIAETVRSENSSASICCIYNGYDAADIQPMAHTASRNDAKFRIAYVGTLWNLTSIEPVVEAIRRLSDSEPKLAERIELLVAGRRTAEQEAVLDRLIDTPCTLIREGYVTHQKALEIMQSADAQCLLLSDVPEAGRVVPAKTFEYLALERPILYAGPQGEVSEILNDFPQSHHFIPSDTDGIADYLATRLLSGTESGTVAARSAEQFERRQLTGQLAALFNQACDPHTCGFEEPVVTDVEPEGAIA